MTTTRAQAHPRSTPERSPRELDRTGRTLLAVLVTTRPRQWIKNLLVLTPAAAAGSILSPTVAGRALLATLIVTVAAAGVYLINDARDVLVDRAHPTKSRRPVAAGQLAPATAFRIGLGLEVGAVVAAGLIALGLLAVVVGYVALNLAYSTWLKHIAVLDILVVAAGFVLRTLAGAAANGIVLSSWFLLVALFGSLYLVTAKRAAELARSASVTETRVVLADYPAAWLAQVMTVALSATVLTYATWALQYRGFDVAMPVLALSVVPFLAVLLRYGLLVAQGEGEAPDVLLTHDRFLLVAGAVWAGLTFAALYLV